MFDSYRYCMYLDTRCLMRLSGDGAKVTNGNSFRILTIISCGQGTLEMCSVLYTLEAGEECASEKLSICATELWHRSHDSGHGTAGFLSPGAPDLCATGVKPWTSCVVDKNSAN